MQNLFDNIIKFLSLPSYRNRFDFAFVENIPSIKKIRVKKKIENFLNLFSDFRNKQSMFSSNRENNYPTMRSNRTQGSVGFGKKRISFRNLNLNKYLNKYTIAIVAVLIVIGSIVYIINSFTDDAANNINNNTQPKVQGIIAESSISKEFLFPLKDAEGEVVSSIKFEIVDVSLRDEVLVQGQKAYPTENKLFLIMGVKITNELDQPIEMSTKDYVRLVVNGNENELLAPEMHNDPVEIQAISTKRTRLGFSVDRNDSDFVLKVGEINGDKQDVSLTLNK